MAKDGQIGSRGLLKSLATMLGMEGVNQAPAQLNRDQVQVTTDLLAGGFNGYSMVTGLESSAAVDGVPSFDRFIAKPIGAALNGPAMATDEVESRVMATRMDLRFDAAGLAAFAGKEILVFLKYNLRQGQPVQPIMVVRFSVDAAILVYTFSPFGAWNGRVGVSATFIHTLSPWNGWIPAGTLCSWFGSSVDGTNFPANTVVTTSHFSCQVPRGARPPI